MFRLRNWIAVIVAIAGTACAAEPGKPDPKIAARVAELVRELGNKDFDRRQAAQAELVQLGPTVLPILDTLEPFTDPEVIFRVGKLRRAVGGVNEELRELLVFHSKRQTLQEATSQEITLELSPRMLKLITDHRVAAGDFLLRIIADPKHELNHAAANAFVQVWTLMGADQIRIYLEQSLIFDFAQRPAYPRGIDAMISVGYQFRYGWGSRPPAEKVKIVTVTSHELDGQPYEKPFRYPYDSAGATTTWVRTKDLAVGKHTFLAKLEFEVEHLGKTVKGSVRSEKYSFDILPVNTPDALIAQKDAETEKLIREALWFGETEELKHNNVGIVIMPAGAAIDWWRPQVTWTGKDGKPNGLHLPVWRLEKPLPVDLVFDVTLRIEETKEEFKADPVIAHKGSTRNLGYLLVKDSHGLAKGRSGFINVRVILKPSRALALTDPKVTKYYPVEIISEPLRIKVGPEQISPPPK
jgi:hypothetical protein